MSAGRARIGIFGGTFDPVHHGHLRTAIELKDALGLDELRLLPCNQPVHREGPQAAPAQRLAMLRAAVDGCAGLAVDAREIERGGPSFSIDTVRALRAELGNAAALCLVIGQDAFLGLRGWREWERLTDHAHLVVVERPGSTLQAEPALAAWAAERAAGDPIAALDAAAAGSVLRLQLTQLDIASSRIRALLAGGRSPRFLLPDAVLHYIHDNGLYGAAPAVQGETRR